MSLQDRKAEAPATVTPLYIGAVAAMFLLGAGLMGSNLPATPKAAMAPVAVTAPAAVTTAAKAPEAPAPAKAVEAPAAAPAAAPAKVAAADTPKPDVNVDELLQPGTLPENVLGDAKAPITIVEYASMSCPHCADFHNRVFPELKSKYLDTGKARMIFREYPLNPPAQTVAMLARCVGPMRYFAFVGTMFERQDEWLTDDFLPKVQDLTKQLGFTDESFKKCVTDPALLAGINASRERGETKFGVNSTPTFFINGIKLKGTHELKDFEAIMTPFMKG